MVDNLVAKLSAVEALNRKISQQEGIMESAKRILFSEKGNLLQEVASAKEIMSSGARLDSRTEDFCFYHFGAGWKGAVPLVEEFVNELDKYSGQLILENFVGSNWTSSRIGPDSAGRDNRSIIYGRLLESPYDIEMPSRELVANASTLKRFYETAGWEDFRRDSIRLNNFFETFLKLRNDYVKPERAFSGINFIGERPGGIYIDINSPPSPQESYGGSRTYDSEPHVSLIIGNKAVKHYLDGQDLKVTTKSVRDAGTPVI